MLGISFILRKPNNKGSFKLLKMTQNLVPRKKQQQHHSSSSLNAGYGRMRHHEGSYIIYLERSALQ
jgi:hypothetical protein